MATLSEDISTLTDRYQTTVPRGVRKQLKLSKGDKIRYRWDGDGRVYIEPVRDEVIDPALGPFLDFIEADLQARPNAIQPIDSGLKTRLQTLVSDVEIDLDQPLSPEDE